ncbi:MAG: CopG family transcriptional regulator [Nitrosotalea sp.]
MQDSNTAVISVKVSRRTKEKMLAMNIKWSEVLRKTIEAKIKERERRQGIEDFLEFRAKSKVPKNRTSHTSEVLARQTREER